MSDYLLDIAGLGLRWLHLIAGIAWIGASFYFVWLDNHLEESDEPGVAGQLWSVHGGGFYSNRKFALGPPRPPDRLHWFKWEAYWTWISGFALLVVVYYANPQGILVAPDSGLASWEAVTLSVALLAVAVVVYDGLCRSPLGSHGFALALVGVLATMATTAALAEVYSGRGAYLQVGAMVGTLMVANVLTAIIPGQRRMVAALRAGGEPDPADGRRGKQRSVHNSYLTLPVLLVMISNHYPVTYGHGRAWLVLGVLTAAGMLIRHAVIVRQRGRPWLATGAAAAALLTLLVVALRPDDAATATTTAAVVPVLQERCASCHAGAAAPAGLDLTVGTVVEARAADIRRMVAGEAMPPGNVTQMTAAERALIAAWR